MPSATSTLIRAFVTTAGLFLAFGLATYAPLRAEGIDDQIKAMKDLEKAGEEGKCIAKMQELKDSGDPKAVGALKDVAKSKHDKIACSAIKAVALRKDPEFLKCALAAALNACQKIQKTTAQVGNSCLNLLCVPTTCRDAAGFHMRREELLTSFTVRFT